MDTNKNSKTSFYDVESSASHSVEISGANNVTVFLRHIRYSCDENQKKLIASQLTGIAKMVATKYFNPIEAPFLREAAYLTLGVLNYYFVTRKESVESAARAVCLRPDHIRGIFKESLADITAEMQKVHDNVSEPADLKDYLIELQFVPGRPWLGLSYLENKKYKRNEGNVDFHLFLRKFICKYLGEGLQYAEELEKGGIYILFAAHDKKFNVHAKILFFDDIKVTNLFKYFCKNRLNKNELMTIFEKVISSSEIDFFEKLLEIYESMSDEDILESIKKFHFDIDYGEFYDKIIPKQFLWIYKDIDPMDALQHSYVVCIECGMKMKKLNDSHLKKHALKIGEYKSKYRYAEDVLLSAKKS